MSEESQAHSHRIFTVGHGTRSLDLFIAVLESVGLDLLVDVRTIPRSRHNPQFNRETLPGDLRPFGIGYIHQPGLGGLRKVRPESLNTGWRNASFRGFADYMQTEEFESNLNDLIERASQQTLVLMCAETLPWRCHRSLIADALLVRGMPVTHLFRPGDSREHRLTGWARVEGYTVTYPALEEGGELV